MTSMKPLAISHFSMTTVFYPAFCIAVNILFVAGCLWRRHAIVSQFPWGQRA